MTGLFAAGVAARMRRELQANVEMVPSRYGEFKVVVDCDIIIDGGPAAYLGVLPSGKSILTARACPAEDVGPTGSCHYR